MDRENITFSELVKEEASHLEMTNDSAMFFLISFFSNNGQFELFNGEQSFIVSTHYLSNIRLIKKCIEVLSINLKTDIYQSSIKTASNKTKWVIQFHDYELLLNHLNNLKYQIKKMNDDQASAFCLGAFLSAGSISFAHQKSNYHFEIRSKHYDYLNDVKLILEKINVNARLIKYRNAYKLYVKRSEEISDILKFMKTIDAMYKFEDFRIQKDFNNSLQRINNLDISNINKTIIAANEQIKWIKTIKQNNSWDRLDNKTKIFANIRMQNPESSLEQISNIINEQYNLFIPRTSMSHLIKKIKNLYYEIIYGNHN